MDKVSLRAYAKINFILNVLGTRPDGYHEVETVMQAVSLWDDVSVFCSSTSGQGTLQIALDPGREDLPADSGNLAWKAAALMHETFHGDCHDQIVITVVKRIPVAAGLAGGSADCAAVINGLARLWDIADEEALLSLGAKLGADVPFCILSQRGKTAALATGIGTVLQPIRPTACQLILSTPAISVPTKAVYQELRDTDCCSRADVTPFTEGGSLAARFMAMSNHLQGPSMRLFPEISQAFRLHRQIIPAPLRTQLSGSGPTVFSVVPSGVEITVPSTNLNTISTIICNTMI